MQRLSALIPLAVWSFSACSPAAEPSSAVAYEGARLIVGDGSAAIENAVFTVDAGRILSVGAAGDVAVPSGATRVDLTGMTVMPAIIDTHVHMNIERDALINDLKQRAYFGVGAAMSMGSDLPGAALEVRDEMIPGAARFLSAGSGITGPEPGRREVHWVKTEEEARQAVRDEAARKVSLIKIWVDDRDGQYEKLSPALYGAIIDEAHKHQLRVAAHIFKLEDGKGLLRAGLDILAHGVRDREIDDEFLELVAERPNLVLIPNLPEREVKTEFTWLQGSIPDAELAKLQTAEREDGDEEPFKIQAGNLARMNQAGVTIAVGSDGNTPWSPHVEMEDMVVAGMTPAQVIVAATQTGAAVLGLNDLGAIKPGKSADFIVLRANPLDDIKNTRQIASVYLRGEKVDRTGGPVK